MVQVCRQDTLGFSCVNVMQLSEHFEYSAFAPETLLLVLEYGLVSATFWVQRGIAISRPKSECPFPAA